MPRQPKPWFRKSRGVWYVQIDRQQHNLGPDKKAAMARFHELMARPKEREPVIESGSLVAVFEKFLDWTEKHRAPRTYDWYRDRIQEFVSFRTADYVVAELIVSVLKPFHVYEWVDSKNCSDGHKRGCLTAVQRALRWAKKIGHIDSNPIADLEKPPAGKRDRDISEDEWTEILSQVQDTDFVDLLTVAWECGPRPQELLAVEARHVDVEHGRWVFTKQESKGKQFQRVVYLTDRALEITKRLLLKCGHEGRLFCNAHGRPWTRNAVNCYFERIQQRMGRAVMREQDIDVTDEDVAALMPNLSPTRKVKGTTVQKTAADLREEARRKLRSRLARGYAPKYCLYLIRHSWMTRLLKAGVDPITVSVLAGHVDASMLCRTYQHLARDADHLRNTLRRAAG